VSGVPSSTAIAAYVADHSPPTACFASRWPSSTAAHANTTLDKNTKRWCHAV
jgi:hypothetical protein